MQRQQLIRALVALLLGLFIFISLWTYHETDWPAWRPTRDLLAARNACGFVGAVIAKLLLFVLGRMALVVAPTLFLAHAVASALPRRRAAVLLGWAAAALLLILWAGSEPFGGLDRARLGWLGLLLGEGLLGLTGATGSIVVLGFLSAIALLAVLPFAWLGAARRALWAGLGRLGLGVARAGWLLGRGLAGLLWLLRGAGGLMGDAFAWLFGLPLRAGSLVGAGAAGAWRGLAGLARRRPRPVGAGGRAAAASGAGSPAPADPEYYREPEPLAAPEPVIVAVPAAPAPAAAAGQAADPGRAGAAAPRRARAAAARETRDLPAAAMLADPVTEHAAADQRFLEERAELLVEKLASFNIGGRVSAMSQGPVVTTYEFEPDSGVKVNQILSRREDLALALRSKELRIVAPIPGKAAVGVEVPNPKPRIIRLREVLDAKTYEGRKGDLALALGVDVDGRPYWADLAEMPHLLVAGATGTGKSVCINGILISLLLAHKPETLRLFLVDPKMLELSVYNEIPHLLHPVITDNRVALKALNWLVGEMERRYRLLKPAGVRSIHEYNDKVRAGDVADELGERVTETLPFIVGIVEEFADLMMTLGKDIQTPIIRLAQMARAVGIHLVLATQRPSVDIIDGVIKANFPSRIAFKVFSRFDSKTILDGNGAETLIGRGDMLFKHGRKPFPQRLHGAFVDTAEVERIVDHWREYTAPRDEVNLEPTPGKGGDFGADDELYDDARRIVVNQGFGSTTMLQRRLRVGYTRASRLMDMLEDAGVVGPHTGSKAREVLVGPETLEHPDGPL